MGETKAAFDIIIGNLKIPVMPSIVVQWGLMVLLFAGALYMSRGLKEVPKGKQVWAELIIEKLYNMVDENMGKGYESFKPYIGSIFIYLLAMNLAGFLGFSPPTSSYSVSVAMALLTFIVIQGTAIKRHGILRYFTAFGKPFAMLLPVNIMERLTVPLSLSLRLFGNMMAGTVIVELAYKGLESISEMISLHVPVLMTFFPIPVHLYFDAFDGAIQTLIFTMLTMIFIKTTSEH
jgi:F-type H+-transporting ATPase subunit a